MNTSRRELDKTQTQTYKQVIIMNAFTVKTAKNELSITQNSNNWPILVGSKGEHKIEAFDASTQKLTFWVGDETLASCHIVDGGQFIAAMIAACAKRAKLVQIEANSLACANKVASKNKKNGAAFQCGDSYVCYQYD